MSSPNIEKAKSNVLKHWLDEQKPLAKQHLRHLYWLAPSQGILVVAQAWLVATVVNGVLFNQQTLIDVLPTISTLLGIFLLRFLVNWQTDRRSFLAASAIKLEIRQKLFSKLRELGPVALTNHRTGSLSSSYIEGVESLEPYFSRYLPAFSMLSMVPLVILLVVIPFDLLSATVLLVTAPLIPMFMVLIGKSAESLNHKQWKTLTRMGAHFFDVVQGLTTLKIFNASKRELNNIAQISNQFRRSTMAVLRIAFLTSAVLEFFAAISIAIIAVLIGFRLLEGEMAFFYGFFILLLAPEFYSPLRNFGVQNHARLEAIAAAEGIVDILQQPSQAVIQNSSVDFYGDIRLNDISHSYEAERPSLKHANALLPFGKTTAIIGASGAGKSTLAKLLLGFISPDEGNIVIGGRELSSSNITSWRSQITWLPQKSHLFHGTIRENIALGNPKASLEQVRKAAAAAQALSFIRECPQGFDTLVGEGGMGLSGGQIQRIAIARAFLRDTPYLLLDEPTAHLDSETADDIQHVLSELQRKRCVVIIAHRLQTIRQADHIIVMNEGAVKQQGTYKDLIQQPSLLADLFNTDSANK